MKTNKFFQPMIVLGLCVMGLSSLRAQQAKNMVLADFIRTEDLYQQSSFPYNSPYLAVGDIWGWTYNGDEYALICLASKNPTYSGSGLAMIKVTDPNNVAYIKTIKRGDGTTEANGPQDVRTFGSYAYVCQDNNLNYYVNLVTALNDTSNPFAGVTDFSVGTRIHNLHTNTTNGLLFLSDFIETTPTTPIPVYDVNSGAPVFKGTVPVPSGGRSHDIHATTSRIFDASHKGGASITDYTYSGGSFSWSTTRSHKYNNRRGKAPNDFSPPYPATGAHDAVISSNGNYLYTTDERAGLDTSKTDTTRQRGAYLRIWDISNIDAPPDANGYRYPIKKVYEVKELSTTGIFANSYFDTLSTSDFSNSIHNVHIRNENGSDVAYVSYYTKGLRILNVGNPLSPSEIGWYDTPGVGNYYFRVYNGSWGVYPFFSSGTIIVSDVRGLYVFRRATEVSGTISSNTTWSGAIFVTGNVTVNNGVTLTISAGTTVAFANGTSLTVNGRIVAESTDPNKRISFTSNTAPQVAGAWNGIKINSGSSANVSTLQRCDVQYATTGITITYTGNSIPTCRDTIKKCRISNNSSHGINVNGSTYSGATVV